LQAIADRLRDVKNIVLVLSGKGGVGKSTLSTQVALALAAKGLEVGLLDIDVCGPSVPRMLGLENEEIHQSNSGWSPVYFEENLGVMSIGFMLKRHDDAIIWRGPKKNTLIKQFLKDVDWGPLDYLVIDAPPGTSDEHITAAHCLLPCDQTHKNLAGSIVVTTPQEVSLIDVKKELNFCKKTGIPVLGVVENMSGFVAPVSDLGFFNKSGENISKAVHEVLQEKFGGGVRSEGELLFAENGSVEKMAEEYGVPYLGRVPMDLQVSKAAEQGHLCASHDDNASPAGACLHKIVGSLVLACELRGGDKDT
jgi:Mrp family chromosome partitioning ATPase